MLRLMLIVTVHYSDDMGVRVCVVLQDGFMKIVLIDNDADTEKCVFCPLY